MKQKLLGCWVVLVSLCSAQYLSNTGGGPAGIGLGAPNPVNEAAGPITSMTIDITSLNLTAASQNSYIVDCEFGTGFTAGNPLGSRVTGNRTPVTKSTPWLTAVSLTALTANFSSAQNVVCRVNSNGGAGPAGSQGPAGSAATVAVGSVATGSAAVTNSGTSTAAVLNFTIPQGQQGLQGDTGPAGPQGPTGPSGESSSWSGTLNLGTLIDYACAEGTITATGLVVGTPLAVQPYAALPAVAVAAWASAADTAKVRVCNTTGADVTVNGAFIVSTVPGGISATSALDFPSIVAGGSAVLTMTVTGATTSMGTVLSVPAALAAGLLPSARVTAANTVTVTLLNPTDTDIDPASGNFTALVR